MSEAEPIPPTSSVTALRIPMIKKGEYDLWSMKMRQYIAITDHITVGYNHQRDQATTDPSSSIIFLGFLDAVDARTLWSLDELEFDDLCNNCEDNISKGYTQATSARCHTALMCFPLNEIKFPQLLNKHPMPTTHEEKTAAHWIRCYEEMTFDGRLRNTRKQSKWSMKKRIVAIEDSQTQTLVATDNNEILTGPRI
ncbi:hypothetical protein Tco_1577332 [Tanacetum coccineum]